MLTFPWAETDDAAPLALDGADFSVVMASKVGEQAGRPVIEAFRQGQGVFALQQNLDVQGRPVVRLDMQGIRANMRLLLMWRTAADPAQEYAARLFRSEDGVSWHDLGDAEGWEGTLTDLAVVALGRAGDRPLALRSVTLQPSRPTTQFASLWTAWTTYQPWTQSTINYLRHEVADGSPSPLPLVALCCGVAILFGGFLWWLVSRLSFRNTAVLAREFPWRRRWLQSAVVVALVGWLFLDGLWLQQMLSANRSAWERFSGKSTDERFLADWDGAVYRLAQHLKGSVLPEERQHILLLEEGVIRAHREPHPLRLRYHLLPEHHITAIVGFNGDGLLVAPDVEDPDEALEKRIEGLQDNTRIDLILVRRRSPEGVSHQTQRQLGLLPGLDTRVVYRARNLTLYQLLAPRIPEEQVRD
ncbi:MAG: hypothetical protein CME40_03885 [Haliea sp.]|nr:hypothetical protein [Haliea sp.]